ncbi:dihydrolipoamide acetyltransferase family protein [Tenuibacillus multivorans]|uniref:Dihydrolipoamide acetyltransferase component of pyruvate dehydrogenase complex n=1 Tax=Tenuibacillus multivorans TaxID=237069 RepID=A0A1H0BWB2_9BACI|nr:dihydrolipoamide acetyltransferase family protein [Tenuibacillus multivorans]GEL77010.1 dihydrolipoamide acetyltransferase component of pyruvate dehydrogenase complex [Tenuibacillus multivorans]SDN49866.1 pyruvate dehydrogenase E2 component (dihydrolipoamide acetyltransferase) [Tenuibacillus multivorans]
MLDVKLHDIGEGMTEGEIVHYFVKEGDHVKADQPLVEVQTDKMVAELPSPGTGTIKEIVVPVGETVQVGTTLLYLEGEGAEPQSSEPAPAEADAASEEHAVTQLAAKELTKKRIQTTINRVLATPFTRKIARDHGIDIENVQATDPSGRVTEEDVYQYINGEQAAKPEPQAPTREQAVQSTQPDEIPFRGIRKQIANKMTKSIYTIPHVTHFDEINMTRLVELREELKASGDSISVPAFLVKALTIALKDFPVFNAELDEENETIVLKKDYHIGLATDTSDGLIVPVLHHADQKSIQQLHDEIKELNQKTKEGQLKPADMQNGTFTVSNVGPLGSTGATPIINYPETALIAFHKTKKMPIVSEDNEIVIGHMMNVSMSFDHRVADGAKAVDFTNRLAGLIENPNKLMLEMI